MIRQSLDMRSWEAAQIHVRELEAGRTDAPTVEEARKRFVADLKSRDISHDTIRKPEIMRR
jgi:hypothetical protein